MQNIRKTRKSSLENIKNKFSPGLGETGRLMVTHVLKGAT